MAPDLRVLDVLRRHGVPFVVIGGHAVNFHGSLRSTEDTDVIWIRSLQAEANLLSALQEIDARFIGTEIDSAVQLDGVRFASLEWLRRMKQAAGRPKDLLDLENLPEPG